jgi:hypothetical protein
MSSQISVLVQALQAQLVTSSNGGSSSDGSSSLPPVSPTPAANAAPLGSVPSSDAFESLVKEGRIVLDTYDPSNLPQNQRQNLYHLKNPPLSFLQSLPIKLQNTPLQCPLSVIPAFTGTSD